MNVTQFRAWKCDCDVKRQIRVNGIGFTFGFYERKYRPEKTRDPSSVEEYLAVLDRSSHSPFEYLPLDRVLWCENVILELVQEPNHLHLESIELGDLWKKYQVSYSRL